MHLSLVAVFVLAAILQPINAFLPTSLNYSDPKLEPFFCPEHMSGITWDHKAITREALRREVRRFLLETVSTTNQTLTIPEDASLVEIFSAYYGPIASPIRFIKAVNSITWSNAMTEAAGHLRFQTAYHMDGESLLEGHMLLQGRYHELVSTIAVDEAYTFARQLLGTSLNSIQDFYSQTTWVELGRDGALEGLGLPGSDLGEVAGPSDPTCTDCASTTGECRDNVIPGSLLSSGYYEYDAFGAADFIVHKPKDAGKCSHGSVMDSSVTKAATGGINKETSSPCFSPHHHLHQQAVEAAISASELYLSHLRDSIGDEHFHNLLDLYPGSALSIIIDTTGSMTYEIAAVKEQSRLIVEKTHPELYVLVPYADPGYGPVTETSNSAEFLEELDKLEAFGGCCCLEEKFWHGLQLALAYTPDYSNIYCFTDAGANDAELMESVLALAISKHCKVTIVHSNNERSKASEETQASDCVGYEVSGVEEYKQLAILTGGTFVEIDKFDVDDVLGIMNEGVQENEVTLRVLDKVVGRQNLSFPVDDSISLFGVVLSGDIQHAVLSHSAGISYNLMNQETLEGSERVEIVSYTTSFKSIRFNNQSIGEWTLKLDGESSEFTVAVTAISSLSFLAEFCELELSPPRPGYRVVLGYPISALQYYIEVTLIGYVETQVQSVSGITFVTEKGEAKSQTKYHGPVDDHFYVLSEPFPSEPCYVQVDGVLHSGQTFSRIFPTMVTSVQCSVELVVDKSVMAAHAGQKATAYFIVENYGPDATFDLFATDEKKFVSHWSPKTSSIPHMGSINVTVVYGVPESAVAGHVSTVTLTAKSRLHKHNVNSAISHFYVLPNVTDENPPTCITNDMTNCEDYNTAETCAGGWWSAKVTLQDNELGMNKIYSRPADNLTVDVFSEGSTHPINATFTGSCCVRKAEVIGRDKLGNTGKCEWDLGSFTGLVLEFVVDAVGESWVYLRWNVSEVRDDFDRYSILIDEDYTDNSRCPNLVCYRNVTYVEPCTLHTFTLTPHYKSNDGAETKGSSQYTDAVTLGPAPLPPTNPSIDYTSDTTTSLSWTPPSNLACLDHYQVCFKMFASAEKWCESSSNNSIVLKRLQPCTLYHINITSVSISNQLSEDALFFDTNTDDAAPGAPQNLKINNQTEHWVSLSWDSPLERATCVDRWMISIHGNETRYQEVEILADNYATVSDLKACTKYTFFVSAVSPKGAQGSTETVKTVMEETEPTAVTSVKATALNASSVEVVWVPAIKEECVHHYLVCITHLTSLVQECHNDTDLQQTFTGLEACVDYEITVTPVSPSGNLGSFTYDLARTTDLRPSPPTNLKVTDTNAHSALVTFGPPSEHPLCVIQYDIEVEEMGSVKSIKILSASVFLQQLLSGLNACTDHEVRISAVTPSGLASEKANVNFTTSEDTPSAPRALTHTTVSVDQIELHWFAPLTNRLCVDMYKVSWTSASDSGNMDYTPSGHPPEVKMTVSGLESCSSYTFTVVAVTPLGDEGSPITHTVSTSC
ncbi:uncharacterized protein LOC135105872 [Scylla paramamosain]|uniref:uncharacterized protein LOC135105872 n=1 Tax=Scylla paramamosain TaxID=85552 RepID=UPI00308361B4